MFRSNLARRIVCLYKLGVELVSLPVARLHFQTQLSPASIRTIYEYFTKPHPKYKVFKNKAIGAALIHLRAFGTGEEFIESLRRTGRSGAERKKAMARGHRLREIDRNQLVEAIHQINVSCTLRQGRPMDQAYVEKQLHYEDLANFRYYGLLDGKDNLVAYCNVGVFGNFALLDRILGMRNRDGAMYMLVTEIVCRLIEERSLDYLMYDTLFGAKPGLREFKRRLGFQPYRARYAID